MSTNSIQTRTLPCKSKKNNHFALRTLGSQFFKPVHSVASIYHTILYRMMSANTCNSSPLAKFLGDTILVMPEVSVITVLEDKAPTHSKTCAAHERWSSFGSSKMNLNLNLNPPVASTPTTAAAAAACTCPATATSSGGLPPLPTTGRALPPLPRAARRLMPLKKPVRMQSDESQLPPAAVATQSAAPAHAA